MLLNTQKSNKSNKSIQDLRLHSHDIYLSCKHHTPPHQRLRKVRNIHSWICNLLTRVEYHISLGSEKLFAPTYTALQLKTLNWRVNIPWHQIVQLQAWYSQVYINKEPKICVLYIKVRVKVFTLLKALTSPKTICNFLKFP